LGTTAEDFFISHNSGRARMPYQPKSTVRRPSP
jgi:hypothetical protein